MTPILDRSDLLNLPSLHVTSVDDIGTQYHVYAEADSTPASCPKCGSVEFYRHGSKPQVFIDLPSHGRYTTIHIDRKRYRCRACGATTLQPMPDMALTTLEDADGRSGGAEGHSMTRRLVEHVAKAGLFRTFLDVARETGLDERTVRRIVADHIRQLETTFRFETPTWLGLDEIHILGKVCGVVANVERHCLVDILPSREQTKLARYIAAMPDTDLIELVAIDMWRPYKEVVNDLLPKAELVIDRFHVVRMANDAMDVVRKVVRKELPTKQRLRLKDDRFLLFSRESKLDKRGQNTVARWATEFPLLGDAWAAKEMFLAIWDTARSSKQAGEMVDAWKASLPETLAEPFHPLVRAMGNWREDILRFFDKPVTNAYTEALNSVIRIVNRIGRGYSFEILRAKMLYAHGQHVLDGRKLDRRAKIACSRSGPFTPENSMVWGVDLSTLAHLIEVGEV